MTVNFIDRSHDEEIIGLVRSIMGNGTMRVETFNEAVLIKLMEMRGTPILYKEAFRDINKAFESWKRIPLIP